MKDNIKKSRANLLDYSENSKTEGFCVFHNAAIKKTRVYESPQRVFDQVPEGQGHYVGYMAYPNPTLKNEIPSARFYKYERHGTISQQVSTNFKPDFQTSGKLEQSVTKVEYIHNIHRIKELLAAGEIYQLNYAIRFRKKFSGSPYHLYLKLLQENATRFSVFLNAGNFQVISHSPELLFQVKKQKIITEPIKGTAAKPDLGKLLTSEKERAELDMITDLERNDVGKICEYGTLKLTKNHAVMELPNLWHTYSRVEGVLPPTIRRSEIIEAMFPGGSITGCPKKRAMQYIEKFEENSRNLFTGSLFFIDPQNFEASICIRTAIIQNGVIEYWAGGGIVADSDPEKEYAECLLKAERILSGL